MSPWKSTPLTVIPVWLSPSRRIKSYDFRAKQIISYFGMRKTASMKKGR
jgi:hypothetical protein